MKTKRGQKLCKKCNAINGVRAYNCKKCNDPFPMKKKQKTDRGVYIVKDIEDNGISVYGGSVNNHGYSYLYMGKETKSAVCDNVYRSPHKILLLNDVSLHPRLT